MSVILKEEGEDSSSEGRPGDIFQVFRDEEGFSMIFYFHHSVRGDFRRTLTSVIKKHGGRVTEKDTNTHAVICDEAKTNRRALQLTYDLHRLRRKRDVWVEPMSFIRRCIREGVVRHYRPEKKGMGGVVGRTRNAFTEAEDLKLCRYLALRIPQKKDGGRFGTNIYIDLSQMAEEDPKEYGWVNNHPWQSWRERYKMNAAHFDPWIAQIAEHEKPGDKQRYHLNRGMNKRNQAYLHDGSDDQLQGDEELNMTGGELDVDSDEEASDDYLEMATKQRYRSEYAKRTIPTTSSSKRQRVGKMSRISHTGRRGPPPPSQKPYGNQKAKVPTDEDSDLSSLFGGDDELEGDPPQAGLDIVAHPASSPFRPSQMTLVGATPLPVERSANRDTSPVPSPIPHTSSIAHAEDLHEQEEMRVSPDEMTMENVAPGIERPSKVPFARKKAQRAPIPPTTQQEPPYRNTRSRSRSVGAPVPSHSRPSKKNTGKGLEPLEEIEGEEALDSPAIHETQALVSAVGETLEERDVEDALVANRSDASITFRSADDPDTNKYPELSRMRPRGGSLATDDGQINTMLQQSPTHILPQFPASSYPQNADPTSALMKFTKTLPSVSSQRSSIRATRPRRVLRSGLPLQRSSPRPSRSTLVTTPTHSRQSARAKSTSSTESFPIRGTRASALKKKNEDKERRSPYKPPAGTRAARFIGE